MKFWFNNKEWIFQLDFKLNESNSLAQVNEICQMNSDLNLMESLQLDLNRLTVDSFPIRSDRRDGIQFHSQGGEFS